MTQTVPGPNITITSATPVTQRRGQHVVQTLTGLALDLQTPEEKSFYESARDKYMSENVFSVASDMRALDRLLFFETQMFRWQWQLSIGVDYEDMLLEPAAEVQLRRNIKETAPLIVQIQDALGLTKSARDKQQHESVGSYIETLKQAAKQHGIRREKQLGKAMELMHELFNLAGTYRRSNDNERKKLGYESPEDIIDWVLEYAKPEYDLIDEHFRTHQQRFWIREV